MTLLCRDCGTVDRAAPLPGEAGGRCGRCGSPRRVFHPELADLALAHVDCDAFYASVEIRDAPQLAGKPVIVGGGRRGVVLAASYAARRYGVRSAMPMFKALAACPQAVVIRPDMDKYRAAGHQVRAILRDATPRVEPLALDEAFLDLSEAREMPARALARIARRVEREVGVTLSIGLSYNKFLAKIASDLDKPRGFAVIGRAEAAAFLAGRPVGILWGVGPALRRRLEADGLFTVGDLQRCREGELVARYGRIGRRLYRFARGEDDRAVVPDAVTRSVSAETTFERDVADPAELKRALLPLCDHVAARLAAKSLAGRSVVLKLKRADFRLLTRHRSLPEPTRRADRIFAAAAALLDATADGSRFRLIGAGIEDLCDAALADPPDLFDPDRLRRERAERAAAAVRARLGPQAIATGGALAPRPRRPGRG